MYTNGCMVHLQRVREGIGVVQVAIAWQRARRGAYIIDDGWNGTNGKTISNYNFFLKKSCTQKRILIIYIDNDNLTNLMINNRWKKMKM